MGKSESEKKKSIVPTVIWGLLGLFFVVYGFIARGAGSGNGFYVVWFIAGVICFLIEVFRRIDLWGKIPAALRPVLLGVFAAAVSLFIAIEALIISGFFAKGEPGLDYIIVLGAQVRAEGPSVVLKYRLDKACDYLNENPETIAICTGGRGKNEFVAEGIAMKEYLVEKGIAEDRILVEDRAVNTTQNIQNSFSMINPVRDRVGILTNNFHVFRSTSIAKRQGGENIVGIAADSHPLYLLTNMVREFVGVTKDIVLGNM